MNFIKAISPSLLTCKIKEKLRKLKEDCPDSSKDSSTVKSFFKKKTEKWSEKAHSLKEKLKSNSLVLKVLPGEKLYTTEKEEPVEKTETTKKFSNRKSFEDLNAVFDKFYSSLAFREGLNFQLAGKVLKETGSVSSLFGLNVLEKSGSVKAPFSAKTVLGALSDLNFGATYTSDLFPFSVYGRATRTFADNPAALCAGSLGPATAHFFLTTKEESFSVESKVGVQSKVGEHVVSALSYNFGNECVELGGTVGLPLPGENNSVCFGTHAAAKKEALAGLIENCTQRKSIYEGIADNVSMKANFSGLLTLGDFLFSAVYMPSVRFVEGNAKLPLEVFGVKSSSKQEGVFCSWQFAAVNQESLLKAGLKKDFGDTVESSFCADSSGSIHSLWKVQLSSNTSFHLGIEFDTKNKKTSFGLLIKNSF